ncbi:hypothetical protein ETR_22144 [Erwinia tracheiphila PSU-1]|nr:hypothetical protein ETR_22144 [Erwinia tracheiphila PSU-1]
MCIAVPYATASGSDITLILVNYKYIINFSFKSICRMLHALHRSIATADLTLTHYPPRPLRYLTGILFSLLLALAAIWLSHQPALAALGLGALTLAIVAGMLVGNTFYPYFAQRCNPGVMLAKQRLLRIGIILYGFRLTLQQIAGVGISGVLIDVLTLSSTFMLACL